LPDLHLGLEHGFVGAVEVVKCAALADAAVTIPLFEHVVAHGR
jgi:hypothetical protein